MTELAGAFVRQFLGQAVVIVLTTGPAIEGQLVSFDGRSLWVVTGGEDRFVPLADVARVGRAPRRVRPARVS